MPKRYLIIWIKLDANINLSLIDKSFNENLSNKIIKNAAGQNIGKILSNINEN